MDKIYSSVLTSESGIYENEAVRSILIAFDDKDKLKPARTLSKMLKVSEIENFLIEKSFVNKVKDVSLFLVTVIPVIIAIIQILLPQKQPGS